MPTVTLSTEADVATWSSGIAAGLGQHLPVGYWSSAVYRSAMRFPKPSWAAWTKITKATLEFSISDHSHVGVRSSGIYIRQQSAGATLWTKAEGATNCETGFAGSNTSQYDDLTPTTANQVSFTSGTTANARKSIVVTAQVQSYFSVDRAKLVFIFDPMDSNDYTEIWSRTSPSNTYDAKLIIEYENAAPPSAPTLLTPTAAQVIEDQTPTFTWNHVDPDAQTQADIEVYDAAGTTLVASQSVMGTAETLDLTTSLPRGLNYQWKMRTYDAVSGVGAWSALRTFTVRALPVVTVSATRKMVFANGAPRLVANWVSDQPQTHYRVQSSAGYDSGWLAGADVSHVLSTQAVVSGTAQTLTVSSRSSYGALEGSSSQAFTPRYGLTTHRRDLTVAPLNWGSPVVNTEPIPTDASLVVEYGSSATATAAPSPAVWYSALAAVPKARYVFWRAWFIPSAVAGPTLNDITIPVDSTVTLVDKWGTARDVAGLAPPWAIDPAESVYGTRSMTIDANGVAQKCYSYGIKVKPGRSYILTGLMKSSGNSGAHFRLEDSAGNILIGGGVVTPVGPVQSDVLAATKDWFDIDTRDVNRYKTPIWVATAEMTVYVVLAAQGAAGGKAWWDAIKLEESTVATPWSPGAIGATVVDAGGVQVDGYRGGILRYKGTAGGARDVVEGFTSGLRFGGDTELTSPSDGNLAVDGALLAKLTDIPAPTSPAVIGGMFTGPTKTAVATTVIQIPLTNGGRISGGAYVVGSGEAGIYWFKAVAVLSVLGGATNFRVHVAKNGANLAGGGHWEPGGTAGMGAQFTGLVELAVGDTLDVRASGGSGTSGASVVPYLDIFRIGPSPFV